MQGSICGCDRSPNYLRYGSLGRQGMAVGGSAAQDNTKTTEELIHLSIA